MKKITRLSKLIKRSKNLIVGVTGFEPATTWSQTRHSTGLSYAPETDANLRLFFHSAKFIFAVSALIISCTPAFSTNRLKLHYNKPAHFFEEALPIGNGKIGAMVYGRPDCDRLSLNDITLWTGEPDTISYSDRSSALANVRKLLDDGKYIETDLAQKALQGHYSENYQPLGDMLIKFDLSGNTGNYRRELDLSTALASTSFTSGPHSYHVFCVVARLGDCSSSLYRQSRGHEFRSGIQFSAATHNSSCSQWYRGDRIHCIQVVSSLLW